MPVYDVSRGDKKLVEYITPETRKVMLVFYHGIGDCAMSRAVLKRLRELFPHVHFDVGIPRGLDIEKVIPEARFTDGDWRERHADPNNKEYDFVFSWNFPLEKQHDLTKTKAEVSCVEELGIDPICGYVPIKPKPLVLLSFNMTSIPWVSNAEEEVAHKVWDDVLAAGCVPKETHFEHAFHNPVNKKYDFVDNHVRCCAAKLDNLMSLLGAAYAFIGVVSGPFHLAMSIMPSHRVMLLERDLKREHFTKIPIATANLKNYNGEVKRWLEEITRHS